MDNLLDLADQAMFVGERATGATGLLQCAWVYNRAINADGLRKFHGHLQRGRLSRSIERSPLPFGRHRWVSGVRPSALQIAESARPRAEFDAWLIEQAHSELDAEHGPAFHLAVLPFTDGGTGVSLVLSHCLADGLGLCEALTDADSGRHDPISWPAAGTRRRARCEDARQTARDIPGFGRGIAAAARLAWRERGTDGSAAHTGPRNLATSGSDERVTLPMTTVFIDAEEWDARAQARGGTSNALFAAVAARLAQRVGRATAAGSLTVAIPVNERTAGDTRANAVTNVDIAVRVPPGSDLREIRATIKHALVRHQQVPNERWALMPLVPLVPKRLVKQLVGIAAGGPTTVIASNLGVVNPAVARPDGTAADYFAMMSLFPGVTTAMMHRSGGRLALMSGQVNGRIFVSVLAYQQGRCNTNDVVRQDLLRALNDFSLTATAGWPGPEPIDGAA